MSDTTEQVPTIRVESHVIDRQVSTREDFSDPLTLRAFSVVHALGFRNSMFTKDAAGIAAVLADAATIAAFVTDGTVPAIEQTDNAEPSRG